MKIIFAGTPEFALAPLRAIVEGGFDLVGVITQEDKPQGRKGVLTPPPVKTLALSLGLPVFQPAGKGVPVKGQLCEILAGIGDSGLDKERIPVVHMEIPDGDILRIVQHKGGHMPVEQ